MSFEFVRVACLPHEEAVHRAWKPKESPLAWRRKPSDRPWRRVAKKSVRRSKCVWCVCVMTLCQVAQGNQNKMAKLPRTSLTISPHHQPVCYFTNWLMVCWYKEVVIVTQQELPLKQEMTAVGMHARLKIVTTGTCIFGYDFIALSVVSLKY